MSLFPEEAVALAGEMKPSRKADRLIESGGCLFRKANKLKAAQRPSAEAALPPANEQWKPL